MFPANLFGRVASAPYILSAIFYAGMHVGHGGCDTFFAETQGKGTKVYTNARRLANLVSDSF